MKKISLVFLTMLVAIVLSACGGGKKSIKADFITTYAGHYESLNYLYTSSASDSDLFANFVDGLVENDNYQRIVPSLAYKWEVKDVTDDSGNVVTQKYTFHIRPNVQWVTKKGEVVAEVTAQDWIDAAKYILEPSNNSQVGTLWNLFVKNAANYTCGLQKQADSETVCGEGATTNFDDVGIKKIDDYTLEYTLTKPAPYFLTALTYNPFFPVYGPYLEEQGSEFGYDGNHILYNGAYVMGKDETNALEGMVANDHYWDKEHVYLKSILFIYVPAQAGDDWARLKYENGELSSFRLTEKDQSGWEKYITGTDGTGTMDNPANPAAYLTATTSKFTYYMQWNWGRGTSEKGYDKTTETTAQQADTMKAIQNSNFRLGFLWGLDRTKFLSYYTAKDYTQWMRNTYMPAKLAVDVENNKDYVDYLVDELKTQNPNNLFGTGTGQLDAATFMADGYNGEASKLGADGKGLDLRYQPDIAKEYFAKAKQDMPNLSWPITIETVGTNSAAQAPYYKAAVDQFNADFGDYVKFVLLVPNNDDEWSKWASQELCYDIRWFMGWGPDYADPATYLNTFVKSGDMLDYSSLDNSEAGTAIQNTVLSNYTDLVKAADKEIDIKTRYELFAKAEYDLIFKEAIVIPFFSRHGNDVYVSKIKPYTRMDAPYGLSGSKWKGMVVLPEPVSREQRAVLKDAYDFNRPGANE